MRGFFITNILRVSVIIALLSGMTTATKKKVENKEEGGDVRVGRGGEAVNMHMLQSYTPQEIISIIKERGVAVECISCSHRYIDKKERDIYTYDYSICPKCYAFVPLLPRNGNGRERRKKVIISRIFRNTADLIAFLNNKRYDFPSSINVVVTLKFNSKEEAISQLSRINVEEVVALIES
ncbi:MAG: hypothetical protein QXM92_02000 [Candidatus Anstonellales archaeon]